jgi:Deoxyribonuclease NucA/NucB
MKQPDTPAQAARRSRGFPSVSNPVVRALQQVAERVGRSLSKDAGRAIAEMYRKAGTLAEDVVKRVTETDAENARKLVQVAERLGRNAARTATGEAERTALTAERAGLRKRFAAILDPKGETPAVRAYQDAEIRVDSARYPETAQHIQEAQSGTIWRGDASTQGASAPSVLTIDRDGAKANRAASLRGIAPRGADGLDRDEYPPAMFSEGGAGASVKYIDSSDNRGAGSVMGSDLDGLPDGARVRIVVK